MYSEMERSGMTEASAAANPFASLFAAQAGAASAPAPAQRGEPNAAPLPNPWAPAPAAPAAAATAAPPLDLFGGALGGLDSAIGAPPGGALGGFGGGGGFGAPHGADPLEHLSSIMEDPAMGPAMSAMLSNPAVLETMLATNPALQAMIDADPAVRGILTNHSFMQAMLNPANIRSMRQMQQSMGGSGFGAMGGGAVGGAPPWMAGAPGSLFGAGANPFAVPAQPQEPPEVLYASQLAQLRSMGFYDETQNLRILAMVNGNVSAAVERLLSQPF